MHTFRFYPLKYLILFVFLFSCKTPYHAKSNYPINYNVNSKITDSITQSVHLDTSKTSLQQYLEPLHQTLEKAISQEIGVASEVFKKEKIENSLGFLITDAMLFEAKKLNPEVSISIYNYGGIRVNQLNKGTITLGEIFEVLPFENTLAIVSIKGVLLKKWCSIIAQKGGWPVTGITFTIKKDEATQLDAIDDTKTYNIVTNDYIAAGNDGCEFLKNTTPKLYTATVRDIVIQYIKQMHTVTPDNTHRIQFEK